MLNAINDAGLNPKDIECAVIELLVSIAMVGNMFVDYLSVKDLTFKGIFISLEIIKKSNHY